MELRLIEYGTPEHKIMVDLRNTILREPLGLIFSDADLQKEKNDIHIGCYLANSNTLVGCCLLTPLNEYTVQLRQMAVSSHWQKKGIGSAVLVFAQEEAANRGHRYIYLHARKEAVPFYKMHDYTIESDQFMEVGIPHFEMLKEITLFSTSS